MDKYTHNCDSNSNIYCEFVITIMVIRNHSFMIQMGPFDEFQVRMIFLICLCFCTRSSSMAMASGFVYG